MKEPKQSLSHKSQRPIWLALNVFNDSVVTVLDGLGKGTNAGSWMTQLSGPYCAGVLAIASMDSHLFGFNVMGIFGLLLTLMNSSPGEGRYYIRSFVRLAQVPVPVVESCEE